ncbi:hypothetical protein V8C37DRAFT_177143 [Trichoderma ceciliae]
MSGILPVGVSVLRILVRVLRMRTALCGYVMLCDVMGVMACTSKYVRTKYAARSKQHAALYDSRQAPLSQHLAAAAHWFK